MSNIVATDTASTTGTGAAVPVRHMTNDDKQLEALLAREERDEDRGIQHALKDLKSVVKADTKAHKARLHA